MSIACVVPTVRPECLEVFLDQWLDQFNQYNVIPVIVKDGEEPTVNGMSVDEVMGDDRDLIFNKNDGVRNLGFAYVAKYHPDVEYILTLDDDTKPFGDTIGDHLKALNARYPLSWMSTASEYMRGVPYNIRDEAECVVSHGVWEGVKDWDAPTQLVLGNRDVTFYKGAVPKGVYFPFCGMNVMFKSKMLPFMAYAPMGYRVNMDRFADIWLGINLKRYCDTNNLAICTGFAKVLHERASNVWKNLQKESKGLELNENYWKGEENDPYFELYNNYRSRWEKFINEKHTV